MNKLLIGVALSSLFVIALFFISWVWWTTNLQPPSAQNHQVRFVITPGESATQVLDGLHQHQLIRSVLAAKIYLKLHRVEGQIKPGAYSLSARALPTVITNLISGPTDVWVTLPEGWRREQIATRIATVISNFDAQEFLRLTAGLEGQLFPDTYLLPAQASPDAVVRILTQNFLKKTGLNSTLKSDAEILTLASLVEREARSDPDRAIIAGILKKRLRSGWPLQVDATVQYAVGTPADYWPKVIDTQTPSVYNTYLHPGLPPAPISNPGLAAIQAVRQPQATDYWYYLTDAQGTTHYARTLAEHNLNIDKFLRP